MHEPTVRCEGRCKASLVFWEGFGEGWKKSPGSVYLRLLHGRHTWPVCCSLLPQSCEILRLTRRDYLHCLKEMQAGPANAAVWAPLSGAA